MIKLLGLGIYLLVVLLIALFVLINGKAHNLRIRDPINKTNYLIDYKVLEKIDKESKDVYWMSVPWQKKIRVPRPPNSAVDVGKKGKKYAEAYRLSEDEFVWITDKGLKTQIDGNEIKILDNDKQVVDTFQPYSVVQRDVTINQHLKAEAISKGRWTPDKIIAVTAIGAFVVIILSLFIFWGDIAKPVLDSHEMVLQTNQKNAEISHNLAIMIQALGIELNEYQQPTQTMTAQSKESISNPSTKTPTWVNRLGLDLE
jgi:hypothetical protein